MRPHLLCPSLAGGAAPSRLSKHSTTPRGIEAGGIPRAMRASPGGGSTQPVPLLPAMLGALWGKQPKAKPLFTKKKTPHTWAKRPWPRKHSPTITWTREHCEQQKLVLCGFTPAQSQCNPLLLVGTWAWVWRSPVTASKCSSTKGSPCCLACRRWALKHHKRQML